jgi:hypothetical protein
MINVKLYAKKILPDIEDGLGDVPIMEKHGISPIEYLSILDELKGIEKARERRERQARRAALQSAEQMRAVPRCYIFQNVSVYDADNRQVRGSVNDMTANGLQVAGIACKVGEHMNMVIVSEQPSEDDVPVTSSVTFEAECRWIKTEDAYGDYVAGFEIMKISADDRRELQRLIQELTFCDGGL